MKLLKIENSQGHFLGEDGDYLPIDTITKNDLMRMVDLALSAEVEFDKYDSEAIRNQAHQVIYQSVYKKLVELYSKQSEFIDQSERLYLQDYERYKHPPAQTK